ncbi:MAG: hypothetical protein NZ523_01270 [Elioraea sp.]|nr:hypothetical protein [Elioraea sp.]
MKRIVLLAFLVAACGGRDLPPEPADPTLARLTRTALAAWAQERPAQAAELFRDALRRAYARDDAAAIGNLAASLAAAELRLGEAARARETAAAARAELARRNLPAPAELPLAEAAARYRLGDAAGALGLTVAITGGDAGARARFIEGLIAADRGDRAGLAAVRAALPADPRPDFAADAAELAGRDALLAGDAEAARSAFLRAAHLRQEGRDYPGLARALALASEAAERQGRLAEAADLAFRSGRSAAADGARAEAERRLERAIRLARTAGESEVAAAAEAERRRLREEAR